MKRIREWFAQLKKPTGELKARDKAVQIGQVNGDVFFGSQAEKPSPEDLREALRLHALLPVETRRKVVKWAKRDLGTGMLKSMNADQLGRALRYLRAVHRNASNV